MYPERPACSAPRSLPWGRRAGKGQCGETSCNAPEAKNGTHKQHGHRADNTHTLRGVRHDTQPHAVTHVQSVTHHTESAARRVQCVT